DCRRAVKRRIERFDLKMPNRKAPDERPGLFCRLRDPCYFGMTLSISCMIGRLKLYGILHAARRFLALS
ncbi:MAG: hypothetical protein WA750_17845, partial [Pseudolabrys sp.]